jgi:hypothetical protein
MTSTLTYSRHPCMTSVPKGLTPRKKATRLLRRNGKNPVMAILKIIYQQKSALVGYW